jgi:hypothetical protein
MAAVVVALALAGSAASGAADAIPAATTPAATVAPQPLAPDAPAPAANDKPDARDAPDAPSHRARASRPQARHAPGHGIDETVRRLTRGLELDPGQQAKLREILWDEQRQARRLRENPGAGVDWASATATIVDQTKARIRAMLTDDQRKKYATDVPHDLTAPGQADLQHWMQLQESKRQQDDRAAR